MSDPDSPRRISGFQAKLEELWQLLVSPVWNLFLAIGLSWFVVKGGISSEQLRTVLATAEDWAALAQPLSENPIAKVLTPAVAGFVLTFIVFVFQKLLLIVGRLVPGTFSYSHENLIAASEESEALARLWATFRRPRTWVG